MAFRLFGLGCDLELWGRLCFVLCSFCGLRVLGTLFDVYLCFTICVGWVVLRLWCWYSCVSGFSCCRLLICLTWQVLCGCATVFGWFGFADLLGFVCVWGIAGLVLVTDSMGGGCVLLALMVLDALRLVPFVVFW